MSDEKRDETSGGQVEQEKPHVRVVAAEIEKDGCFLITQRNPYAVLPLLWEFPGGKVEFGESDVRALARELFEGVGVHIKVGDLALAVCHEYDRYTLDLLVYKAYIIEGEPTCKGVNDVRWVKPCDLGDYEFPGADQQTVDALLSDC